MEGLDEGPWVTWGYFNTVKRMMERQGFFRITNIMADIFKWIEDLEFYVPILIGGKYTWTMGFHHQSNARLDRFLYAMEWEESFKNIKQRNRPIVTSDPSPIIFEFGDWEQRQSYFKFVNWWLKVEEFNELVLEWWNGFMEVSLIINCAPNWNCWNRNWKIGVEEHSLKWLTGKTVYLTNCLILTESERHRIIPRWDDGLGNSICGTWSIGQTWRREMEA